MTNDELRKLWADACDRAGNDLDYGLRSVFEAGRREGAETMREAAAKVADDHACEYPDHHCASDVYLGISALPTETGTPE